MTFPWSRVWLTIGALLPYWQFLTLEVVYVTDDVFASDIFNGELPGRALIGRLLQNGEWPVWTSELCSGLPLAGSPADPLGLLLFWQLPLAAALDLYVIALLLIAAHGAYGFARRVGADTTGAVLAGLAFAGSGYIAVQLKHLAIIATVVWLPIGLLLIDRVMDRDATRAQRSLWSAVFALVFAQQVLAGFPQSAYICALAYGAFTLFKAIALYRHTSQAPVLPLALLAAAVCAGAAAGAVILLPLSALAEVSGRAELSDFGWATHPAYWPANLLTFLIPYINGDISNATYRGPSLFWEDYGYVGLLPFALAVYAGVRERKRPEVWFLVGMTVVAMLFVLGRWTLVYRIAYELVPGMSAFRFPTRFLIVVQLGLAVLAAIGLTRATRELERRRPGSVAARLVPAAICVVTALDLFFHQPRQNPVVPADAWLAPPPAVAVVSAGAAQPRTFTPNHRAIHREAFARAKGWADVTPYFELRGLLEPNTGAGFWNVASADCYAGIASRWTTAVWGDHNQDDSLVAGLAAVDAAAERVQLRDGFTNVMRTFGVTHVLLPFPQQGAPLTLVDEEPGAFVYRVDGSARARFVASAQVVEDDNAAAARLLDPRFDPDGEVLVDAATLRGPGLQPRPRVDAPLPAGTARISGEGTTWIDVAVEAASAGYLVLADSYYPGWTATIDGQTAPILRANIASRAVAVPAGSHIVRMTYELPGFSMGWKISVASLAIALAWLAASLVQIRRAPLTTP